MEACASQFGVAVELLWLSVSERSFPVGNKHKQPKPRPVITVTGKSVLRRGPDRASITVTIEEAASDRNVAWEALRVKIDGLRSAVGEHCDISGLVPVETKRDVTRHFRQGEETVVTVNAKVEFPVALFGEVITAVVNGNLSFTGPEYINESDNEVTAEQLVAATEDARAKAAAIVEAAGGRLGELVAVEVGSPGARSANVLLRDWLPNFALENRFGSGRFDARSFARKEAFETRPPLDLTGLELAVADVPVRDITVQVTLGYEILPVQTSQDPTLQTAA